MMSFRASESPDGAGDWTDMAAGEASLILEDGTKFSGRCFGNISSVSGEVVFQTGMVGYVESLTDPSYYKQLLVLTYPLIGNYGVPDATKVDKNGIPLHMESSRIWPSALIVDNLCNPLGYSHWQACESLQSWMAREKITGLCGVDTRSLTKLIREHGTMKAKIVISDDDVPLVDINATNLVAEVSRREATLLSPTTKASGETVTVLAIDCGLKNNQLRCLLARGVHVKVVPWNCDIASEQFDGLFLSNGPGDPEMCVETVRSIREVLDAMLQKKRRMTPVMGICLGHQLLSRAAGARTYKLTYGNRGHNQPCLHPDTGKCFITTQNHGYAVDGTSLDGAEWSELFVNRNDGTNEGIVHNSAPIFSVQFHPEHMAGPMDMECLFDVFVESVRSHKEYAESRPIRSSITILLSSPAVVAPARPRKVMLLGSGGLSIGQAGEFDYSGSQALKALREEGVRTVLINPNIATVQTNKGMADKVLFLPVEPRYVEEAIKVERPDGILLNFGGQTALNCGVDLQRAGVMEKYGLQVLGTPIDVIELTEDRQLFAEEMVKIGEPCAPSKAATTIEQAVEAANGLGYPVLVRAAYALGGLGSGTAHNEAELVRIARLALANSSQVLVDKSLHGWKELEYEVVRDMYDNCITVCNMENLDPVGIHTGDSIVVAPSQTLNNYEYNMLRHSSIKIIRHLGVVGECNVQFALDPHSSKYYIIEVNARLSRSSALASKATGYPLAYVAAKLVLGASLPELTNGVTGGRTTACFEPSLDYCVVKIPRWDLGKFMRVTTQIGTAMKSVGEVMGIGRSFEEAFQKALRMVSDRTNGFEFRKELDLSVSDDSLSNPSDQRVFALAAALYSGDYTVERIHELTKIDCWFLSKMANVIHMQQRMEQIHQPSLLTNEIMLAAKQLGFCDQQIANYVKSNAIAVRKRRLTLGIRPWVRQIDTVAAEWPAVTNYLYLTYCGALEHDVEFNTASRKKTVAVLGSGVYRIGSSVEFDCCSVGCVAELRRLGYETVMVNCNPETVSTDYDMCDRLYFEDVRLETVLDMMEFEHASGVILSMGGQQPNNIAMQLQRAGVRIYGTAADNIDAAENRFKFSRMLDTMSIGQPQWKELTTLEEATSFCSDVGYPCLVRPSYVLSGAAMNVVHEARDLEHYLRAATVVSREHPVVISKFILDAKEIDVDGVAFDGQVRHLAVCEHVENAGVHSGDATLVTPPQDLTPQTLNGIEKIVSAIASKLNVSGPFNIQVIAKDDCLKVIECNVRISRSFPFVSKTLGVDLIAEATHAIMGINDETADEGPVLLTEGIPGKVGVKVPVFSFSRLSGADVVLGVEMSSTGEVAGFGSSREEAYLKALLSSHFRLPPIPNGVVLLSIGHHKARKELFDSVLALYELGMTLYGSIGTADYYNNVNLRTAAELKIIPVDWPFEDEGPKSNDDDFQSIGDYVANKQFHLIINIPKRGRGTYRVSSFITNGYKTRRMAVDNGIPLITDVKCAKLLVKALSTVGPHPAINLHTDALTAGRVVRLPGFVDVHVHTRDPGETHKEDWTTVTQAALAGAVTMVIAMPNTKPALVDRKTLMQVQGIASRKACCDYGFNVKATPTNAAEIASMADSIVAVKMYLNQTHNADGTELSSIEHWRSHFDACPESIPIMVHAEGVTLASVLFLLTVYKRPVHVCHVSTKDELSLVIDAKQRGLPVTCEVCPHHLFLTTEDYGKRNGWSKVKPPLGTKEDQAYLWRNMRYIDVFATDHAPHTKDEKSSDTPPPGFPGLETMLPLLLTAVKEKRLTMADIVSKLSDNPRRIFNLPEQPDTFVEVDLDASWTIPDAMPFSRAAWTPFAGMQVYGYVRSVVLRGSEVYSEGEVLAEPGFGRNVCSFRSVSASLLGSPGPMRKTTASNAPSDEKPPLTPLERSISPPQFKMQDAYQSVLREMKQKGTTEKEQQKQLVVKPRIRTSSAVGVSTSVSTAFLNQHVLTVKQFRKNALHDLFELASAMKVCVAQRKLFNGCKLSSLLEEKRMILLFYEASTRTSCSFRAAMELLGGHVDEVSIQTSSVKKGESLEDTVRVLGSYRASVIVLRHPERGSVTRAARALPFDTVLINAGDGTGEHPTQALLDVFTIREERGTVNKLTVGFVGDLVHGRTVHSLARLLTVYDVTFVFIAPKNLAMPPDVVRDVRAAGKVVVETDDLTAVLSQLDVLYMTRIQRERFQSDDLYNQVRGHYLITPELLSQHDAKDNLLVMHPLPRVDEISPEFDSDNRAAYFRQAENGLYVRMALLLMVLGQQST